MKIARLCAGFNVMRTARHKVKVRHGVMKESVYPV